MKNLLSTCLFLVSIMTLSSCSNIETYSVKGWEIEANTTNGTLSFSNTELGIVAENVKLVLGRQDDSQQLKNLKLKNDNSMLTVNTQNPETEWTIKFTETGIDFSCSSLQGLVTGVAPAAEKRIPARVKEQDNDVMFTQMGFVSATNIHNLFDMNTDIMIQFSPNSKLTRNIKNNSRMDISFKPVNGEEITLIHNYYNEVVGLSRYDLKDYKPVFAPIADRFKSAPTGWSSWYC